MTLLDRLNYFLASMRSARARQAAINACIIPIDATLSKLAHSKWPTCEAIRFRDGICEWAINSSHGWQWFPISRLPRSVEYAVLDHIRNRGR